MSHVRLSRFQGLINCHNRRNTAEICQDLLMCWWSVATQPALSFTEEPGVWSVIKWCCWMFPSPPQSAQTAEQCWDWLGAGWDCSGWLSHRQAVRSLIRILGARTDWAHWACLAYSYQGWILDRPSEVSENIDNYFIIKREQSSLLGPHFPLLCLLWV